MLACGSFLMVAVGANRPVQPNLCSVHADDLTLNVGVDDIDIADKACDELV